MDGLRDSALIILVVSIGAAFVVALVSGVNARIRPESSLPREVNDARKVFILSLAVMGILGSATGLILIFFPQCPAVRNARPVVSTPPARNAAIEQLRRAQYASMPPQQQQYQYQPPQTPYARMPPAPPSNYGGVGFIGRSRSPDYGIYG